MMPIPFNPKVGVVFKPTAAHQLYASFAKAHKEPNRTDFENGSPVPEELNDFELGWRWKTSNATLNANIYYMGYKNQLVLTGAIDKEGAPIRANAGDSFRGELRSKVHGHLHLIGACRQTYRGVKTEIKTNTLKGTVPWKRWETHI